MSQSYVSYYEVYDANGNVIYAANGYVTAKGSELAQHEFRFHNNSVLQESQKIVPNAVSIIFKGFFKL
ncbi:hypothetical protein DET60_102214 [Raoultella planticola]|uniref:hypothetical protein n=1 Tax=Raoultella planticola TaxID=575 RepID=UPI001062E651|nr:hypothetical protein [Raoultella planticola]TDV08886.1 hypothetical protein DFO76_103468 [Raoultella planticola]TDX39841.1 hypothetical protein DET60_102214 [Raoultella planticola]